MDQTTRRDGTISPIFAHSYNSYSDFFQNIVHENISLYSHGHGVTAELYQLLHFVQFSQFYWHFGANLVMHICSVLQVCILAIWSQGLIWIHKGHTQLLAPRYLFLDLIQGAFWVQNGKNDGFTKMSVESLKSYIVQRLFSATRRSSTSLSY